MKKLNIKRLFGYNYEECRVIPISCFSGEEQFQHELASVRNCGEVKTVKHKTNLSAILKLTPFAKNSSSPTNAGEGNMRTPRAAFTLAEVLITLTIIGVIAALTIPNLITSYQKHVVETKVVKFYSMINNAMKLSYIDNGSPEDWITRDKNYTTQENRDFLNKYFLPYIKYSKIQENCRTSWYGAQVDCIILTDGSMFSIIVDHGGVDLPYFVNGKTNVETKNYFVFQFAKLSNGTSGKINSINFIEPYTNTWNGTYSQLKSGNTYSCNKQSSRPAFCTKLLQLNNWKITKDYPW